MVVDDGSSDRSAAEAAAFGPPVRVARQANAGPSAARNRGIAEARGEWIAFLDSDDVWARTKLALQAEATRRFPTADLVFCDTTVRSDERLLLASRFDLGGVRGHEVEKRDAFARYDRGLFGAMLESSRVISSAVMVRRTLPELRFREDMRTSEDWALWLRLVLRHEFASVDRVLVTMYRQGDNLSADLGRTRRTDVRVLEDLLEDPALSGRQRADVDRALARRRFDAMYFSLVAGDRQEARRFLRALSPRSVGRFKYLLYWLATALPAGALRTLAKLRLRPEGRD